MSISYDQRRIPAIVRKHKPRGWTVIFSRRGLNNEYGTANFETKTIKCAKIRDVFTLLVFLHECGHVHLRHAMQHDKPEHLQEYEAERYALHSVLAEGFGVSGVHRFAARDQVQEAIARDREAGLIINSVALGWAEGKHGRRQ